MSYAVQRSRSGHAPVGVGARAFSDPVLARASLDASAILLAMAKAPAASRLAVMQSGLERLAVRPSDVVEEMKVGLRSGVNPDQVAFDSMRLAIANTRLGRGIDSLRHQVASEYGWDSALGTLSANDRATGCLVAGGAATAGGVASIIPVYGTIVGLVTGVGSGVASAALDCGKEARDAASAAQQAQAQVEAAQQLAAAQQAEAAAASRRTRIRTLAGGAAALLALAGVAWLVVD